MDHHDREFIPIREPRDRSRDRSLERGLYLEDELYGRSARQSPNPIGMLHIEQHNAHYFVHFIKFISKYLYYT